MKKIIALMLALVMVLCLAACGKTAEKAPEVPASAQADPTAAPATDPPATEAPAKWPEAGKTLTIYVNYAAGNTHDIMCRTAEPFLEKVLGIDIDVINVEGGSGLVGLQKVLALPSDGYSLVTWSNPKHDVDSVKRSDNPDPYYSFEDWMAIGSYNMDQHIIVVPKDSPFETLQDLIDAALADPEGLTWSGTGAAPGVCSLACDAFEEATGTAFTYVPYSGGTAEVITALLGGHTDVACLGTSGTYANYVETGELKCLGLIANERKASIPDVPCVAELIGKEVAAYAGSACRMVMIKADTDPEIIKILQDAWNTVGADPEFIEKYQATGAEFTMVTWEQCQAIRSDTCVVFSD